MAGFTRRYSDFPSIEVLQEIEGVVTVDGDPPGTIDGISAGVACCVGEFADMTHAVAITSNGVVSTSPQPTEVLSGQDLRDRFGGFDSTIGEFGGDGGSGFLDTVNKTFARLVIVAINLCSSQGARVWRKLPTNTSATDPSPVVPLVGGVVTAGREFVSGSDRVHLAQRVQFSELGEFASGVDGAITAAGAPAAFQSFSSAGGLFTTRLRPDGINTGVQVGDILVLGVIDGAGALGANADTYRVRSVTGATAIVVEKMNGASFDWTTGTAQPWRIHPAECADTGGENHIGTQAGYRIPVRALDASIAVDVNLTPVTVPEALTAQGADPLSGLALRSAPTTGIVYTAAVQAANAVNSSALDALYVTAIESLIDDDLPEREVNIVWCSRSSTTIDTTLKAHALAQKANGVGRIAVFSPPLDTLVLATAIADTGVGVGSNRYREGIYCWPGLTTFVREAVGISVKGADGLLYTDGILDTPSASWACAIMSKLVPERDPGQARDPVKTTMALTLGIQRGVTGLGIEAYKALKRSGVMGPRNDRQVGRIFQSGVTRSLQAGEKEINVRRFSFFVEDSVAAFLLPFSKEPVSEQFKDQITTGLHGFFMGMASVPNKGAARIRAFIVDAKSGNTPATEQAGIFVVKYAVEMIPIARTIVQQARIGLGVIDITDASA
jgi:hypothetical protein